MGIVQSDASCQQKVPILFVYPLLVLEQVSGQHKRKQELKKEKKDDVVISYVVIIEHGYIMVAF